MTQRLNRRSFLRLTATAAGGGLLAACVAPAQGTDDSGASMAEEPIEIRLAEGSWVGPEGISFWTDEIIPSFEDGNPGINVTFENAESPDYADKLYTQAVAGDSPDMFVWDNINYNLLQKGQLLQLDDYFDSGYRPLWSDGSCCMPKYVSTVVMAYNKDILEAGVDHPDETWTWDDYQWHTRQRPSAMTVNIVQWGNYVAQGYIQHYVWMNGGEWMNGEIFGTQCLLDSEKALEGLKFNHDQIFGDNPVAPIAGSIPEVGWHNVFSTGNT